jgi:hypothetical protein
LDLNNTRISIAIRCNWESRLRWAWRGDGEETHSEIESQLGILLADVGKETGFFVSGEFVCEGCSGDGGCEEGQQADYEGRYSHGGLEL